MFFIHSHMMSGQTVFAPKSCESVPLTFPCKLPTIILIAIVCKVHVAATLQVYMNKKCPEKIIF